MKKLCSRCGVEKKLSEFHVDNFARNKYKLQSQCKACKIEVVTQWSKNNPELANAKNRAWRKANPEKSNEQYKRKIAKNPEKYRVLAKERVRRHRKLHPPVYDSKKNIERVKRWKKLHPEQATEMRARRRLAMRRIPAWGNKKMIRVVYQKAREWKMEVDHCVPLRHPLVCGLHVWANLQLLKRSENATKRNRLWPDMP